MKPEWQWPIKLPAIMMLWQFYSHGENLPSAEHFTVSSTDFKAKTWRLILQTDVENLPVSTLTPIIKLQKVQAYKANIFKL